MMRVWMSQCLCPQRHAILAGAGMADEADMAIEAVEKPLRESVEHMLRISEINPWCGLCHARADTWHYETEPTKYRTMWEATEPLRRAEAANIAAGLTIGELARRQEATAGVMKFAKDEVGYVDVLLADTGQPCAVCRNYRAASTSCALVEGAVSPGGSCTRFAPVRPEDIAWMGK